MGRPEGTTKFDFNEEQAKRVEAMAAVGLRNDQISSIEGMSPFTLKNLYQERLTIGRAKGINNAAQTLYELAVKKKNLSALIFFLKTKGRWKETQGIELSGPDGEPLETKNDVTFKTVFREVPKDGSDT